MPRFVVVFLTAMLLSLAAMIFLLATEIPLGIPGEWTWQRIRYDQAGLLDFLASTAMVFFAGGLYVGLVGGGANRIEAASRFATGCRLLGLALAGFLWLHIVQQSPPEGYGIEKAAWVLYYPASSGYFHEAKTRKETAREYLAHYQEDIQSQDTSRRVLHHGTHPPGLFLCYRGLMAWVESSPRLMDLMLLTQPRTVKGMFDGIQAREGLQPSDRAVIWLAMLLTQLAGAMVVLPLYFLSREMASKKAAWLTAACWPLVPALAVFLPKSDVLYAFLGTAFVAVWWSGWQRKSVGRCFAAGIIFWVGMLLSLALLPVAFLAAVWTVWSGATTKSQPASGKKILLCFLAGLLGFVVPCVLFWWSTELNLAVVWWQNYLNHAEFYQHFQRSYAKWLFVNPVEALFAVGLPMAVLVMVSFISVIKNRRPMTSAVGGAFLAVFSTLFLLWITGKNRGEAARLWLVMFPFLVWLSAGFWQKAAAEKSHNRILWPLFILQMLACWVTVLRVNGFPL